VGRASPPHEAGATTGGADGAVTVVEWRREVAVVAVVASGGAVGGLARVGVGRLLPAEPGQWPVGTLLVNLSGCLLLGGLLAALTSRRYAVGRASRWLRPFLGVGVLGGYTTFSGVSVETSQLLLAGQPMRALLYLTGTALAAVLAVWLGAAIARRAVSPRPRDGQP